MLAGPLDGKPDIYFQPQTEEEIDQYRKNLERKDSYVRMLGSSIAWSAIQAMHYDTAYETDNRIYGDQTLVVCPGRKRIDTEGRENYDPGYTDAPDVHIAFGLLQIGDINFVTVGGEIYSEIGLHLKAASASTKTVVVTLANGPFESGYIYSNNAGHHLTFQVIGSRLQRGYAEDALVDMMKKMQADAKKR